MTREEAINGLKSLFEVRRKYCNMQTMKDEVECLEMAIKALEQEPCADCISRQAALDTFGISEKSRKYGGDHSGYDTIMLYEVQDALEALPPVQPQQKTGRWIENAPEYQNIDPPYICSECGNMHLRKTNYCDQCGCRMYKPQEDEDKKCI